jgi:NAD(P)-dependent dehydrogenase (short-subunit alcohol dehydrogenase family)
LEDLVKTKAFFNPMGALLQPEDISRVVVFLCHPDSRYITGQTQYVNAGGVMP